ncbi:hypothetical protein PENFLA_c023G06384 [Penicillium flavigenum]|uniref:F-box domain-containing protein n=1 Tax=Penicillium flavigenum TaxID=254877 RepID=A0A1V6SVP5_9EURO|nr:hypothetical protein PENFLA_c023G06384 [Penicillium flavigenum]
MASEQQLVRLWKTKRIQQVLSSHLASKDLISCRLVCRKLAVYLAPILFADIEVRFRSSTFDKPSRMAALERVGVHIQAMTFKISHDRETFLPPILDPITGTEQPFIYTPQRCQVGSSPRYGSRQMTELLVKQYPPLFHASTNIPSFVQALTMMRGLQHLRISCEGQQSNKRRISTLCLCCQSTQEQSSSWVQLQDLVLHLHLASVGRRSASSQSRCRVSGMSQVNRRTTPPPSRVPRKLPISAKTGLSLGRREGPLTPVACNRAEPEQYSEREANSSLPSGVRITLGAIEIPTSSADGAGQCNNGRVAGGVFHPGAPEFPARVQLRKRGAPQRQLGRCARAIDKNQREWKMEAGSARHRHRGCADRIESSGSQPETVIEGNLCFAAIQKSKNTAKLGQSGIADTRVAVGEPGSYEVIAAVFGV